MTSRTDDELVAAYQAGEESAATELVRRHADPVARYLYARGASPSDVDDLVQEAFFRAFRALDSWRGAASFRSWLYRIAGNYQKDQFRRVRNRTMVPIEDHDVVDAADPAGDLRASELSERIQAEIEKLPRLQREVFLLRAQQGLDYNEICAVVDTTPGAARVHYHHAVKRLKELVCD
jgi:RNA polymerase sigma-70 factor (ECF subfamily)